MLLSLTQENAVDLHAEGGGLQVTDKGRSAFSSPNHCQGQLRSPLTVTVVLCMFLPPVLWFGSVYAFILYFLFV